MNGERGVARRAGGAVPARQPAVFRPRRRCRRNITYFYRHNTAGNHLFEAMRLPGAILSFLASHSDFLPVYYHPLTLP